MPQPCKSGSTELISGRMVGLSVEVESQPACLAKWRVHGNTAKWNFRHVRRFPKVGGSRFGKP